MAVAAVAVEFVAPWKSRASIVRWTNRSPFSPDLTWNQGFIAIDDLHRAGKVRLNLNRGRTYIVRILQRPMLLTILG